MAPEEWLSVLNALLFLPAGSFFNFRIWWLSLAWLLEETVRYGILFWVPLLLDGILSGHFNGKSAVTSLREPPLIAALSEDHNCALTSEVKTAKYQFQDFHSAS